MQSFLVALAARSDGAGYADEILRTLGSIPQVAADYQRNWVPRGRQPLIDLMQMSDADPQRYVLLLSAMRPTFADPLPALPNMVAHTLSNIVIARVREDEPDYTVADMEAIASLVHEIREGKHDLSVIAAPTPEQVATLGCVCFDDGEVRWHDCLSFLLHGRLDLGLMCAWLLGEAAFNEDIEGRFPGEMLALNRSILLADLLPALNHLLPLYGYPSEFLREELSRFTTKEEPIVMDGAQDAALDARRPSSDTLHMEVRP